MTDDIVTRLRNGHGEGCSCFARCYCECGCDAIWAEHYTTEAANEIEHLREKVDKWRDLADSLARFGNCESPDCPDCDRDWKLIYQNYEQAVRGG